MTSFAPSFAPVALAPLRERPLLFLDFEASSLTPGSWPVEIGYAWIEAGRVRSRATLIAPRTDWSMDDWSEVSARVHGIPLAAIRAGAPADVVAGETDRFAEFEVVSENPAWEQRWLDRLRAGRRPRIEVRPIRAALRERLDDAAAGAVVQALFRSAAPHRAGPDAERLARAWLAATRAFGVAA
jgi:hypothetical protein